MQSSPPLHSTNSLLGRGDAKIGSFAFADPHGRAVLHVPERPAIPSASAWERIRDDNAALGIDGNTAAHGWDGQPINCAAAVGALSGELHVVAICSWSEEESDDDDDYVYPENYDHVGVIDPLSDDVAA